jgi:hypothetical protein
MLGGVVEGIRPMLPWLVLAGVVLLVVACPLPGRGPGFFSRRDPWRGFRFEARKAVLARAGNRCEAALVLAWGRCAHPAQEADHVYPWSRGGATVVSNGQALCTSHNRAKSNLVPPWWYVMSLERRRRSYFPPGMDVSVSGAMGEPDRAARQEWVARKAGRS